MNIRSFPGMYALRFPHFHPDEETGGGEDTSGADDPFAEQPGDREPDPDAKEEPAAEEPAEEGGEGGEGGGEEEAAEEPDEGAGDDTEGAAGDDEGEEGEEEPARKPDWRDRQIIKARKEAKEQREQREALEAENRALKALTELPEGERADGLNAITREEARKEALEAVRREQYFERINNAADSMFDAGQKAFPKTWESRVSQAADALRDDMIANPSFLEAVTSFDNAAAIYHDLASDIDRMEALIKMPPVKMGIELAKISSALAAAPKPKPVSKAPAPIKPLNKATVEPRALDDPELSMEEFNRRMDAEEEKRYASRR